MRTDDDLHRMFREAIGAPPPMSLTADDVVRAGVATRRRRLAVGAVVVATVAVLAAVLTGPAWSPATVPASTPVVDPDDTADPLPVPGLTPARVRQVQADCATSVLAREEPFRREPSLADPSLGVRQLTTRLRARNQIRDQVGTLTLLSMPDRILLCAAGSDARISVTSIVFSRTSPDWMPGRVANDVDYTAADVPGFRILAGRVSADVATVTVTGPYGTRTVPAVNGTYLVRFVRTGGGVVPGTDVSVTAQDRTGARVGEIRDVRLQTCYRLPTGEQRAEPGVPGNRRCPDAVPWP